MDGMRFFFNWYERCLANRGGDAHGDSGFLITTPEPIAVRHSCDLNFVERLLGGKTKFCPNVARLCPVFVPIVSIFGQILSRCGLIRGRTFRIGSQQTGETRMKIDGDSGAVEALVRRVLVHATSPRARARFGPGYDSGRTLQVQYFQFQGSIHSLLSTFH
ncbi:hypothetical protein Pan153_41880 [Gimesia panareensis]|uniref:Uncharacterized protein n=1 Tax=Gimesia panareensis TaxID=2527978 RepID=A0A518FT51_9PLAN|nr:hypothetical protein Pan153_41880 [Gimesia panareensis]